MTNKKSQDIMIDAKPMLELILSRQSDRSYTDRPKENEKLDYFRLSRAAFILLTASVIFSSDAA